MQSPLLLSDGECKLEAEVVPALKELSIKEMRSVKQDPKKRQKAGSTHAEDLGAPGRPPRWAPGFLPQRV